MHWLKKQKQILTYSIDEVVGIINPIKQSFIWFWSDLVQISSSNKVESLLIID